MKRRSFTTLAAAAAAAVPAAAAAQTTARVRIGTAPVESYALAYYAKDQGFFARNGVEAEIVAVPGASGGITAALVGGAIEVGCVSVGPTSNAHLRGIPIRLIAPGGIYTSAAPTTTLLVAKSSPLTSAKDLNGKTVGTPVLRDLLHVATVKWIDANGGDSKTVKIVEMPVTDGGAALESGRVDAYPLVEPLRSAALAAGNLRVFGNPYDAITPRLMISMHIAMNDYLEKNAAVARRVILALRQAARWANGNAAGVAAVLEQEAKLPAAAIARMNHVVNGETLEIPTIQPQINALAEYKFIERSYSVSDIVWR
jgi:NitT/TauT family transport system substrate-binding protein